MNPRRRVTARHLLTTVGMSHRVRWIVPVVVMLVIGMLAGVASADLRSVRVGSIVDETTSDATERKANAKVIRRTISRLSEKKKIASSVRTVDVAVLRVTVEPTDDDRIVVSAEVRVTLSGGRGTHLTMLAGGARVEAPRAAYRTSARDLRADAIGGALEAVVGKTRRVAARSNPRPRR